MKIGINNIFTSFWFLIMFVCGGTLTYLSINKSLFASDLIFIAKFFIGLLILITIFLLFYFFYKFRILIINNNKIVSFYPFWLKKVEIDSTKIKKLKLENWTGQKGTVYKKITVTDLNSKLTFTDREFENFKQLTSELRIDQDKRKKVDLEQAKSNFSNMNFNVYLLSALLIFLVFNTIWNSGFHPIIIAFFICIGILLYASVKRKLEYKKIMKTLHNKVLW